MLDSSCALVRLLRGAGRPPERVMSAAPPHALMTQEGGQTAVEGGSPDVESRRDQSPAAAPEASERLLAQSTRVLRLARELALSADASTIAQLVVRHVGEISGGGPAAVYLLGAGGAAMQTAAVGFFARQPLGPPRVVARGLDEARLVTANQSELPELEGYGASCGEAFVAPIMAAGELFGALLVGVPESAQVGIHPSRLATVTGLAGASLANARRLAQTHTEAPRAPDLALLAAKRAGKDTAITFADDGEAGANRTSLDVLYRELRDRMGESGFRDVALRELWNAGRALGRERTQEGMLQAAVKHLAVLLRATACSVSRLAEGALVDAANFAHEPWRLDTGGMFLLDDYPQTRSVVESGLPSAVSLSDEHVDESEAFVLRKLGLHAVLMLPLHVRGRPWGLVEVYDARERRLRRRRHRARGAPRRPSRGAACAVRARGGGGAAVPRDARLAHERARGERRLHEHARAGGLGPRRRGGAPARPRRRPPTGRRARSAATRHRQDPDPRVDPP